MTLPPDQCAKALRRHAPHLSDAATASLIKMYSSKTLVGLDGGEKEVGNTWISILQGSEIHRILREAKAKSTLEIGFAYGFSTVWIIDAISSQDSARHEAIDPYEKIAYGGVGLKQILDTSDFDKSFVWHEDYSIHKLSDLIRQKREFDAIFIDGSHRFDDIIVDFYLSDQVLMIDGIMAFDDMWMDAVRTATAFILQNRNYQVVPNAEDNMLVLKKIDHDRRPWHHYAKFDVFPREEKRGFFGRRKS